METPVKCLNCGIKWVRITSFGTETVLTEDLMRNCPSCGSNYYEEDDEDEKPN